MGPFFTRREAEAHIATLSPFRHFLDDPGWHEGFESLEDHWRDIVGDRPVPLKKDFDLLAVSSQVPMMQVTTIVEGHEDFNLHIEFMGNALERFVRERPGEISGHDFFDSDEDRQLFERCLQLYTKWPFPLWSEIKTKSYRAGPYQHDRSIIMPVSTDGVRVDCCISASIFLDAEGKIVR